MLTFTKILKDSHSVKIVMTEDETTIPCKLDSIIDNERATFLLTTQPDFSQLQDKTALILSTKGRQFGLSDLHCQIVARDSRDKSVTLVLDRAKSIDNRQRRQDFRVKTFIEIHALADKLTVKGHTMDISGGGVKFITKKSFKQDDIVKLRFQVDNQQIKTTGKLLSSVLAGDKKHFINRVKFINMTPISKKTLISALFRVQSKNIKSKSDNLTKS